MRSPFRSTAPGLFLALLTLVARPAEGAGPSVLVRPAAPVVTVGATVALKASVRDAEGQALPDAFVTWRSDSPTVEVTEDGLVTGRVEGRFRAAARHQGTETWVEGRVVPVWASALLEAPSLTLASAGAAALEVRLTCLEPLPSLDLVVEITPLHAGSPLPALGPPTSPGGWPLSLLELGLGRLRVRSSPPGGFSGAVDLLSLPLTAPQVAADARYSLRVSGTSGASGLRVLEGEADLTVLAASTGPVASLACEPAHLELRPGDRVRVSALAADSEGNRVPASPLRWRVAEGSAAEVDSSGLVTALAPGRALVAAELGRFLSTVVVDVVAEDSDAAHGPRLILPYLPGKPGGLVTVPVLATGVEGLAGLRLDLSLLGEEGAPPLEVGGDARAGPAAPAASVAVNASRPDRVVLGLLSVPPVSRNGVVLSVSLRVPQQARGGAVYPLRALFVDGSDAEAGVLPLAAQEGAIIVPPDSLPPRVALVGLSSGEHVGGVRSLQVEASDDYGLSRLELVVSGVTVAIQEGGSGVVEWDTRAVSDGAHVLVVRAVDNSGNAAATEPLPVVVDNTPPQARITSPIGGQWVRRDQPIHGEVSDANLSEYRLTVSDAGGAELGTLAAGSQPQSGLLASLNGVDLPDGQYQITLTARDRAGNEGQEAVAVLLDTAPPEVAFRSPAEGSSLGADTTVEVEARDPAGVAEVVLLLDGDREVARLAAQPYRWRLSLSGLADGRHTLSALAADSAGNTSRTERSFVIDRQPPEVRINAPEPWVVGGAVSLPVETSDLSPLEFQLEVGRGASPTAWRSLGPFQALPSGAYAVPLDTTTLEEGLSTLRLTVVDAAGNAAERRVPIVVDNLPPTSALTGPAEAVAGGPPVAVMGTADDATSGDAHFASYRLEVGVGEAPTSWAEVSAGSSPVSGGVLGLWDVSGLAPGRYTLRLTVHDRAGNQATALLGVALAAARRGDLNGDGAVTVLDVLVALRAAAGLVPVTPDLLLAGDVAPEGGDGVLSVLDVLKLLRGLLE